MTEMLEHGGLRERALRPEVRDLERLLLSETRGHQLAKQPDHLLVPQRPGIALDDGAQHLRLTLGTVEFRRLAEALHFADLLRAARAIGDQRLDLRVDRIDTLAQAFQRGLRVVLLLVLLLAHG